MNKVGLEEREEILKERKKIRRKEGGEKRRIVAKVK